MGYTWTDGELITATKLNNTGGADYDFIIEDDGDGYTAVKGTYNEVYTALQTRPVSGLFRAQWSSAGNIWSVYVPINYVWYYSSTGDMYLKGIYNDDNSVGYVDIIWSSNGTIADND